MEFKKTSRAGFLFHWNLFGLAPLRLASYFRARFNWDGLSSKRRAPAFYFLAWNRSSTRLLTGFVSTDFKTHANRGASNARRAFYSFGPLEPRDEKLSASRLNPSWIWAEASAHLSNSFESLLKSAPKLFSLHETKPMLRG